MEPFTFLAAIVVLAFICEFVDSSLGMGYGTALTPILLIFGYSTLAIVPAILLSELFTGAMAAFAHNRAGNVLFDFHRDKDHRLSGMLGRFTYIPKSRDSKIAVILAMCSFIGAIIAVFIAINVSAIMLNIFIGLIVFSMGGIILLKCNSKVRLSWKRITGIGGLAAFNKGLSGGGYGPLVTSGQILSGVESKKSIAITSFSESFTCLIGVLSYLVMGAAVDWSIAPYLIFGAILAVPFSAHVVKRIKLKKLTTIVGVATLLLGAFTLYKVVMSL